ncbi:MAG: hypothetical protein H6618_01600 [Deltaproteobacteria bacterium]|nr:hypothetical protein [Deltaproteobacteria bacterium]
MRKRYGLALVMLLSLQSQAFANIHLSCWDGTYNYKAFYLAESPDGSFEFSVAGTHLWKGADSPQRDILHILFPQGSCELKDKNPECQIKGELNVFRQQGSGSQARYQPWTVDAIRFRIRDNHAELILEEGTDKRDITEGRFLLSVCRDSVPQETERTSWNLPVFTDSLREIIRNGSEG